MKAQSEYRDAQSAIIASSARLKVHQARCTYTHICTEIVIGQTLEHLRRAYQLAQCAPRII